jgi:hypothetical protein
VHLVQILLPLRDNTGRPFPAALYEQVRGELTDRFGGVTAFMRAPAQGLWKESGRTVQDDIVVLEVMAGEIDTDWWRAYRHGLQATFRQDTIIVRAQGVTLL